MEFLDCTTENGKKVLAQIYEQLTGRKWRPPKQDMRAIKIEAKIEDIGEIAELMKQKPNYSIDAQGRKR